MGWVPVRSQSSRNLVFPKLLALDPGQMAGHGVAGFDWNQLGPLLLAPAAVSPGVGTARMEWASRRHMNQAWRRAFDGEEPLTSFPVEARYRPQQPPGVGVRGPIEQLLGAAVFHSAPGVHHQHVVGEFCDDAEV